MCKKLFFLVSIVLLLVIAGSANASYIASSNITGTPSSSYNSTAWPIEGTYNGYGLDTALIHHYYPQAQWLCQNNGDTAASPSGTVTGYCWVLYEFDQVYQLGEMWLWNGGTTPDRGFKTCLVEYSTDGTNWTTLGGSTLTFTKAPQVNHSHEVELDFADADASQVLITCIDNWGNSYAGIDEVRFNAQYLAISGSKITASASTTYDSRWHIDNTKNENGLTGDLHNNYPIGNMWINDGGSDGTSYDAGTVTGYAWAAYEFDGLCELRDLWIWNYNGSTVPTRGFKNTTIQYSSDGSNWSTLGSYELVKAPGTTNYPHGNEYDFDGALANYVVLTAAGTWGDTYAGLSEVRFYGLLVGASCPSPADDAEDILTDANLVWAPGAFAADTNGHDVYLGTDHDSVRDANTSSDEYKGRQDANEYEPGALSEGITYYWRIDEVNDSGVAQWPGNTWCFTTLPPYGIISPGNITGTPSSSYNSTAWPIEGTYNGYGLDTADIHHYYATAQWLCQNNGDTAASPSGTVTGYCWAHYQFDQVYQLGNMWIWNEGVVPARSFKTCLVEYSTDGTNWTTFGGATMIFTKAPQVNHSHEIDLNFAGVDANQVLITCIDNWGDTYAGLDEVRFHAVIYKAEQPSPADEAEDILTDANLVWAPGACAADTNGHDVYFGTDHDSVRDANTSSDEYKVRQDANEYEPGTLLEDTTYYWRIDEVNDSGVAQWPGDTWCFTTCPRPLIGYTENISSANITGTASSSYSSDGWPIEATYDETGLNTSTLVHTYAGGAQWICQSGGDSETSPSGATGYCWAHYQFDDIYELAEMWVWNEGTTSGNRSFKTTLVQYSSDGSTWTTVGGGTMTFAKATSTTHLHEVVVDFNIADVNQVQITCIDNYGDSYAGLDEVRFNTIRYKAGQPYPADGADYVDRDEDLSWTAGYLAADVNGHDVYFGTDFDDVNDANTNVYIGRQTAESYEHGTLDCNTTYYWRIDEVNDSGAAQWPGSVWSFSTCLCATLSSDYYVATDGNDNDAGTLVNPFATIEKARDILRGYCLPDGGVTVHIRGGTYKLSSTVEFDYRDSGTVTKPVVYQAYTGETPRFVGGEELDPNWFSLVTDANILNQLVAAADGNVQECNLPEHGITDYGQLRARGFDLWYSDGRISPAPLELCFNKEMMQLARWPNSGFERTVSVDDSTTFEYSGNRPNDANWADATDPYAFGYWKSAWVDLYVPISDVNVATSRITLGEAPGRGLLADKPWYALNILSELDTAGEYYVERDADSNYTGKLYFWPPNDINSGEIFVSTLGESNEPMIDLNDVSYVTFDGITFEVSRSAGIEMTDGGNILIDDCVLRNLGATAVTIDEGTDSGVQNCEIYGVDEGIHLNGGNRYTLVSPNHFARNNHIHHYGRWEGCYRPAVNLVGVGCEASHNLISDAPHFAIWCYYNSHLVQFNEIHRVCTETADSGAIYAGYTWSNYGDIIRHNLICDINSPEGHVRAVYLDGAASGATVFGNIAYNGGYWTAIWNAGGRDNVMENNVIAKCWSAHVTYPSVHNSGTGCLNLCSLNQFRYQNPPWSTAYPKLVAIPNDCTLPAFDEYTYSGGSVFSRNIAWQNSHGFIIDSTGTEYYDDISDNIEDQNPLFYDEPNMILALKNTSPAYGINGFERIQWEQMGLLDTEKASRPIPPDGWTGVDVNEALYWAPAFDGNSRDVYFGTNFDDVNTGDPNVDKGEFNNPNYAPGTLASNTIYYWCVDERDANGDILGYGDVWSFTTEP